MPENDALSLLEGVAYVRTRFGDKRVPDVMGPLADDHPIVNNVWIACPGCRHRFMPGQYVTLVPIGPGDDLVARRKAVAGRYYNAVALPTHWTCVTGKDDPNDNEDR